MIRSRSCVMYASIPQSRRRHLRKHPRPQASELRSLRNTYRRRVGPHEIVSPELARHLTELSRETNRQIGVLLDRKGDVEQVIVGDAHELELPDIGRARAGPGPPARPAAGAHPPQGRAAHPRRPDRPRAAAARPGGGGRRGRRRPARACCTARTCSRENAGRRALAARDAALRSTRSARRPGRDAGGAGGRARPSARPRAARSAGGSGAILVRCASTEAARGAEASLAELKELARTAGVEVVDARAAGAARGRSALPHRPRQAGGPRAPLDAADGGPDHLRQRPLALAGAPHRRGDRASRSSTAPSSSSTSSPSAPRAPTASCRWSWRSSSTCCRGSPGSDDSLSRLAGGIGGRGPGETKLEIDRRRVRDRIAHARAEDRRALRGPPAARAASATAATCRSSPSSATPTPASPRCSTRSPAATVLVEDKLFATLDPTSRRLRFPREREVIITDTVGFIRDLPKDLVDAFRATLEELDDADLLLHVVDAVGPGAGRARRGGGADPREPRLWRTPRLKVWNKADQVAPEELALLLRARRGGGDQRALPRGLGAAAREGRAHPLRRGRRHRSRRRARFPDGNPGGDLRRLMYSRR